MSSPLLVVPFIIFLQSGKPDFPITASAEFGPFFSASNAYANPSPDMIVGGYLRAGIPFTRGFANRLRLEFAAHGTIPLSSSTATGAIVQVRAGVEYATWRVSAGVWLNICPLCKAAERFKSEGPASPVQTLPSIYGRWQPNFWGLAAGVFDEPTGSFGHLDLLLSRWSIGYAFPVGARLGYSHPLPSGFSLDGRAFGFWFSSAYQVGFLVGFSWSNIAKRPTERPQPVQQILEAPPGPLEAPPEPPEAPPEPPETLPVSDVQSPNI